MYEKITRSYTLRKEAITKLNEVSKFLGISKSASVELLIKLGYQAVKPAMKEAMSHEEN